MNEQLIKFIELCLMDGVITDKEREVIFRKSKELGVPEDECEIILESMTFKKNDNKKDSNNREESIDETSQNEIKVNNEKDSKQNTNQKHNNGKETILKKSDYGRSKQSQEEINLQNFIMDFYDKGKVGEKEKKIIYEKSKELGVLKETCDVILNTVSSIYDSEPEPIKKEYEDGVEKNGLFIIKDEGEGRKWEQFYKDGLKHGLGRFYDENGKLSSETNYVMGKKDGLEKSFITVLGTHFLYRETQYKDGKKNGVEKIYSKEGICIKETTYKDDKKTGDEKEFDYNGELESEILWKDDDIIEEKYSRVKEEDKKKKQNLEKKKDLEKEFLSSVVFPNIVNSKSKFYELLLDKDFYVEFEYFDETFVLSLNDPWGSGNPEDELSWGRFKTFHLPQFIQKIKLFVFINLFSNNDFFRLKRKKNIPDSVKDLYRLELKSPVYKKNVGDTTVDEHEFGIYIDKNGWLFNPSRDSIIFYINEINIFNCDLGKVKSISTSPFLKGGMFSKSIIKLKQMSVCLKNGVKGYQSQDVSIEIKSKKLFKETETRYTNWIKFLFTLKDFENQLIGLRIKNLSNSNQELYEFLKGFSKVELNIYVKKVREVLNTKKDEIESKEKEFNSNFIQDFIKIINFVESNIENYWSMNISMCSQIDISIKKEKFLDYNEIEKITKSHNKFISLNSTIIFGLIEMIRSVIYNDRIRFYEIYEKFDKLRIFNSQYQNDVINSLSSINQNLVDLNSKIDNLTNTIEMMSDQILSSINELQFEVSYLNDNITGQLQNISSKLDVNNLLNMVQTYQLYRINSNTKSLRS